MKKCAIYGRVSTPDQSVNNQLYDSANSPSNAGMRLLASTPTLASPEAGTSPGLDAMLKDARRRRFQWSLSPLSIGSQGVRSISSASWMNSQTSASSSCRAENIATDGPMGDCS